MGDCVSGEEGLSQLYLLLTTDQIDFHPLTPFPSTYTASPVRIQRQLTTLWYQMMTHLSLPQAGDLKVNAGILHLLQQQKLGMDVKRPVKCRDTDI